MARVGGRASRGCARSALEGKGRWRADAHAARRAGSRGAADQGGEGTRRPRDMLRTVCNTTAHRLAANAPSHVDGTPRLQVRRDRGRTDGDVGRFLTQSRRGIKRLIVNVAILTSWFSFGTKLAGLQRQRRARAGQRRARSATSAARQLGAWAEQRVAVAGRGGAAPGHPRLPRPADRHRAHWPRHIHATPPSVCACRAAPDDWRAAAADAGGGRNASWRRRKNGDRKKRNEMSTELRDGEGPVSSGKNASATKCCGNAPAVVRWGRIRDGLPNRVAPDQRTPRSCVPGGKIAHLLSRRVKSDLMLTATNARVLHFCTAVSPCRGDVS